MNLRNLITEAAEIDQALSAWSYVRELFRNYLMLMDSDPVKAGDYLIQIVGLVDAFADQYPERGRDAYMSSMSTLGDLVRYLAEADTRELEDAQ